MPLPFFCAAQQIPIYRAAVPPDNACMVHSGSIRIMIALGSLLHCKF